MRLSVSLVLPYTTSVTVTYVRLRVTMGKRKHRSSKFGYGRKKRRKSRKTKRKKTHRRRKPIKTFPKKVNVELTWCDVLAVPKMPAPPPSGGTLPLPGQNPVKIRLNSIFQPILAAPDPPNTANPSEAELQAHQPLGHDQWMKIYNKYCVIGVKVKVEPLWTGEGNEGKDTSTTLFGYVDDDEDDDNYTIERITELGLHKSHKYLVMGTGGGRSVRRYGSPNLRWSLGMKKFFGLSKKTQVIRARGLGQGDENPASAYAAEFGANPARKCCLKLHCSSENWDTAQVITKCRVTIKYMAVLFDPREIEAS